MPRERVGTRAINLRLPIGVKDTIKARAREEFMSGAAFTLKAVKDYLAIPKASRPDLVFAGGESGEPFYVEFSGPIFRAMVAELGTDVPAELGKLAVKALAARFAAQVA